VGPIENLMIAEHEVHEIQSPESLDYFLDRKPAKLWCVGDQSILQKNLLGIISARQFDVDLTSKSLQLLHQLASLENLAFISGWHSPLEEEAFRVVISQPASLVICLAKSLQRFAPSEEIEIRLNEGRGLLLTHCSPKAKRISREASLRRNQLVIGLAKALLVLSAPAGSSSLILAREAVRIGTPVFTPEHPLNRALLELEASPATFENIRSAFEQR
jgi:DNA processing protein